MSNITSLIRIFSHKHHLVFTIYFCQSDCCGVLQSSDIFSTACLRHLPFYNSWKKKKKQSFLKPKEATLIKLISRAFLMPCPVCMQSRKEKKKGEFGGITITCLCIHRHADVMHKWVKFKECCHWWRYCMHWDTKKKEKNCQYNRFQLIKYCQIFAPLTLRTFHKRIIYIYISHSRSCALTRCPLHQA